ncbi:MAG: aldo/keto reductase [Alphaproteobacteria bacterium]|tara:strand:+ start:40 stop:1224 length:1185 start_codon:yes stop_codon:yes gene_type:complete
MLLNRRSFLLSTLLSGNFKIANAKRNTLKTELVRLGNTDLIIPNIGYGSSSTSDENIVKHAFKNGIRYFDTAESYVGGDSESSIGNALKDVRHEIVIGTKTKARTYDNKRDYMKSLEDSLKRLRTDYIDIYYNHAVNSISRLENTDWWEFIDKAKSDGKIRYSGVSGHGSNLADCLEYCIDRNLVDVILSAFSFAQDPKFFEKLRHTFHFVAINPRLPEVLLKAKNKGIGIIAMKTLAGARLNDMRPYENEDFTYAQAAIKWALNTDYADAAIISMTSNSLINELTSISNKKFTDNKSFSLLKQYYKLNHENICPPGCGACKNSCPNDVQISDVMRSKMYALDYKNPNKALISYSAIENNASACLSCSGKPCLGSCDYNLDIKKLNTSSHKLLS